MNNEILISIIVATYNAENVIKRFLDSICTQKGKNVELIIVDGLSTDGTMNIVKNHPIVDLYISEKDSGIYDAWNRGIRLAHGKWIMFIGADDEILPGALESYMRFIESVSDDVDIITAKSEFVDLNDKLIKVVGKPFSWSEYRKNMEIAHGTTLHNRILFERIGLFDLNYKICADYELLMRKGNNVRCAYFDAPIMKFHIGGASFSIACQKETFMIRKKYKSVGLLMNCYLFFKRSVGICFKAFVYRTKK